MAAEKLKSEDKNLDRIIQDLKSLPAFSSLKKPLLEKFAKITIFSLYPPETDIIIQGQKNKYLYFLLKGRLSVKVDNELVTFLEDTGDIIGEMSIISNKAVSATVKTETESEILSINTKKLDFLNDEEFQDFQHVLYKVFAIILTNKLGLTNKKARNFEIINRDLLKVQKELEETNTTLEKKVRDRTADIENRNIEILANYTRLEKLNALKKASLKNMKNISEITIPDLKRTLDKIISTGNDETKNLLWDAEADLIALRESIKHLTTAYSQDVALENKRILILESNPREQFITKMALGGTGVILDVASSDKEYQEQIKNNKFDIICIGTELVHLTPNLIKNNPDLKLIFLSSEGLTENLRILNKYPAISNVVTFNKEDRSLTIQNIATTVNKIINKDIFGIEKYLNWGVEIKEIKITGSLQRQEAMDGMKKYFRHIGIRNNTLRKSSAIAEELLMNSIYDAPTDKNGKALYNHLERTVKIELPPHEQGKLRYASDGVFLGISVEDPFGSLEKSTILKYLNNCYGSQPGTLNSEISEKAGAGLGLFQMISSSSFIIFNIKKGSKTEVIALFELDPKKAKQKSTPSFHFFNE